MHKNQVQYDICVQEDRQTQSVEKERKTALICDMRPHILADISTFQRNLVLHAYTLKTAAAGGFEMLLHGIISQD
jgi:hypothetical protein